MEDDSLTSLLTDMLPTIIGQYLSSNALNDYKDTLTGGAGASAGAIKQGYDEGLAINEQGVAALEKLIKEKFGALLGLEGEGLSEYQSLINKGVADYGNFLLPAVDEYGQLLEGGAQEYGDALSAAALGYGDMLSPYMESGDASLSYLTGAVQDDPSQLTPSQSRAMDDYNRSAIARLAASGLRGAGRAGVAAVNEGAADLASKFYDQNRGRSDQIATNLNSMGYGATDKVGGVAYNTAGKIADNAFNTLGKISNAKLTAKGDIATNLLKGQGYIADKKYASAGKKGNIFDNYYNSLSGTTSAKYGPMIDAAMGKALQDASALQYGSQVKAGSDAYNDANMASTFAKIQQILADEAKKTTQQQGGSAVGG